MKEMRRKIRSICVQISLIFQAKSCVNLVNEKMPFAKNGSIMRAEIRLTPSEYAALR
ncbi:hypothetical protein ACVWWU_000600 [Pantoea sp. PA1]|nr:hypothetical protein L585_07100 [Pantoea ananatis BRT175]MDQ1225641.1 hypothetical protein [Pantoea ananatis]PKC39065.1 hypothetical protein V462_05920 [Pantoea ananatis 15320]PWW18393.1 hypothetical protein DFO57_101686 [Pantoea sp. AG702]MDR6088939.1 hypothetical protein [Pantoea ananatis]